MFIGVPGAPCKARIVKIRDAPLLAGYTESTQCEVKNYTTNVKLQKTVEEQKKREKNKFKKKLSSFFFLNMLPLDSHQIIRPVLLKHTLSSNALSTLDEFACPRVAIPAWVYLQVRLRPCAALGSRTLQVHPEIYIKKTPKSRSLKKESNSKVKLGTILSTGCKNEPSFKIKTALVTGRKPELFQLSWHFCSILLNLDVLQRHL